MPLLTIITQPHKTLRTRAKEVLPEEIPELQKLIEDMKQTMLKNDGIGLAANQINILKRILIISTKDGPLALINPKLSGKSFKKEIDEEGCLSVPDVYGMVKRHRRLVVTALSQKGETIKLKANGLFARVIQHETDHLNGILFINRVKKYSEGKTYKAYKENYQEGPTNEPQDI